MTSTGAASDTATATATSTPSGHSQSFVHAFASASSEDVFTVENPHSWPPVATNAVATNISSNSATVMATSPTQNSLALKGPASHRNLLARLSSTIRSQESLPRGQKKSDSEKHMVSVADTPSQPQENVELKTISEITDPNYATQKSATDQIIIPEKAHFQVLAEQVENSSQCLSSSVHSSNLIKDEYGFPMDEEAAEVQSKLKNSIFFKMKKRKTTWLQYLQKVGYDARRVEKTAQVVSMVRNGIPPELRGQIWQILTGVREYRDQFELSYAEMSKKMTDDLKQQDPEEAYQIDKDLCRTFPGHDVINSPELLASLRRVLILYAHFNPQVGYCQSMNFLAATFLMFMSEEDAFWMLCHMIENIVPPKYYTSNLFGVSVDHHVFTHLIKEKLPKVGLHFEHHGIILESVAYQWLLCLFVTVVPFETSMRIWDCLMCEGNKILFRIALSLLKLMERKILEAESMADVMLILKDAPKRYFDGDLVMKTGWDKLWIGSFPRTHIANLRKYFGERVEREMEAAQNLLFEYTTQPVPEMEQSNESTTNFSEPSEHRDESEPAEKPMVSNILLQSMRQTSEMTGNGEIGERLVSWRTSVHIRDHTESLAYGRASVNLRRGSVLPSLALLLESRGISSPTHDLHVTTTVSTHEQITTPSQNTSAEHPPANIERTRVRNLSRTGTLIFIPADADSDSDSDSDNHNDNKVGKQDNDTSLIEKCDITFPPEQSLVDHDKEANKSVINRDDLTSESKSTPEIHVTDDSETKVKGSKAHETTKEVDEIDSQSRMTYVGNRHTVYLGEIVKTMDANKSRVDPEKRRAMSFNSAEELSQRTSAADAEIHTRGESGTQTQSLMSFK